ncbi:hypothetical protein V511_09825 [Mesotoga sp. Brook.08.YT.4.2.5.1]|uniref:hypothetical protein n=1 Tax=Mesotoga sp. Brook.08.YT.4.2.5.1 TaxID=1421001 RepID=UPI000C17A404|nr:hypothetical protein [Mesotoga sp. Brook.08.YT.4.2.5.1]PNE20194.1 hypothetical protein V511_09825 [Mesotoga sp. Brook.08.YT.4.2.5.1]PVD17323.1 hypothetical protein V512_010410 [Mesotoga sp. Brook.08.105.5.1]RAO98262.1 hypothetical protein M388_00085 [Mesotoga sp. Brook.08.YT.4.2.5.4.]RDI92391.1 hypothetical protein Q502_08995 [Mesotoga sp. Brook.08.YT.4.2.5.2.]
MSKFLVKNREMMREQETNFIEDDVGNDELLERGFKIKSRRLVHQTLRVQVISKEPRDDEL